MTHKEMASEKAELSKREFIETVYRMVIESVPKNEISENIMEELEVMYYTMKINQMLRNSPWLHINEENEDSIINKLAFDYYCVQLNDRHFEIFNSKYKELIDKIECIRKVREFQIL